VKRNETEKIFERVSRAKKNPTFLNVGFFVRGGGRVT